jgi:cytidine deaminase
MKDKLKSLLPNAYIPITDFPVASIVVTNDGKEFCGVNVEDASTRAGFCAERNAIGSAVAAGYKPFELKEIHVMISNGEIGTPCFVCRQLISEFFSKDAKVYCYSINGEVKEFTVSELCPHPFDEESLNA